VGFIEKKGQVPCKMMFAENIIDLVMSTVICHYLIYPTADLIEIRHPLSLTLLNINAIVHLTVYING
jgi:hypothetical protein